jgi:hypothetical protein
VGVTARAIAPLLYVALGISGSAKHLCGVTQAEVIVAVNSDPHAPIFDGCDVGIIADVGDFVAALHRALDARPTALDPAPPPLVDSPVLVARDPLDSQLSGRTTG